MSDGRTVSEIFGHGDIWDRMKAMQQLSEESGASLDHVKDAFIEAHHDMNETRCLLRERGLWETPEARKAKLIKWIEEAKEAKRWWLEQYEQQMAQADRCIAELKEELRNLS
jgi:translation elongation factor EF-Ts